MIPTLDIRHPRVDVRADRRTGGTIRLTGAADFDPVAAVFDDEEIEGTIDGDDIEIVIPASAVHTITDRAVPLDFTSNGVVFLTGRLRLSSDGRVSPITSMAVVVEGASITVEVAGPPGPGVPAGGDPDQVLAKASGDDYDTEWVDAAAGGGGAPIDAGYLVTAAHVDLTGEVTVGATPGGELGGTWAAPTVDAVHSGSSHAAVQAAAEATAATALAAEAALARNADNLTSGTVADARIPSTIARDSEVTTAVSNEATARDAAIAAAVAALINSAPGALDTLDELAAALGDDANFATTVTNALALKAAIADVVLKSLYDANSLVIADSDNTPIVLAMGASTILARLASGGIVAATPAQLRTLLSLVVGTDVQAFDTDLTALAAANNSAVLAATTASFLTADETKLDGIEAGADVTDAANVAAAGAVMDTGDETIAGVKTFTSDPIIPDEAYGAGWNGSLEPPTKNAVYDKIETIGGGSVNLATVHAFGG